MVIEGNDYKINILILLMENEIDVSIQTIETLMENLEEGVIISILLNGGKSKNLSQLFSGYKTIRYYESEKNLGVAGGRNYLLKTEECRNADIIMILDNDVIPPLDYVKNLSTFLLKNKDAGVVGAPAADIKGGVNLNVVKKYGDRGVFGNKIFKIQSSDIKENLLDDLRPGRLFHIGVHPDYYYTYFSLLPSLYAVMGRILNIFRIRIHSDPFLIRNDAYLELIKDGIDKYPVSNVAGCSQAFKRGLLEEIGYLNDMFNPYGFEDVDFCIRARKAGYINYIDTNTWLFHGTDMRHKERDINKMLENQFRCRTILASRNLSNPETYKFVMLKLILSVFLLDLIVFPLDAINRCKAKFRGFQKGLNIIREHSPLK